VAASTSKKVVVHRFDRQPLAGYVNPASYLLDGGIELLSQEGTLLQAPYEEVKVVCFVRDFEGPGPSAEKRLFTSRPKTEGLWVRLRFRDGEFLDGLLANNLLQVEARGFTLIPPDPSSNNPRLFIPRTALTDLRVISVVGGSSRRIAAEPTPKDQLGLFE